MKISNKSSFKKIIYKFDLIFIHKQTQTTDSTSLVITVDVCVGQTFSWVFSVDASDVKPSDAILKWSFYWIVSVPVLAGQVSSAIHPNCTVNKSVDCSFQSSLLCRVPKDEKLHAVVVTKLYSFPIFKWLRHDARSFQKVADASDQIFSAPAEIHVQFGWRVVFTNETQSTGSGR